MTNYPVKSPFTALGVIARERLRRQPRDRQSSKSFAKILFREVM
jgi:hypothetical protein